MLSLLSSSLLLVIRFQQFLMALMMLLAFKVLKHLLMLTLNTVWFLNMSKVAKKFSFKLRCKVLAFSLIVFDTLFGSKSTVLNLNYCL